ncbi:MAG: glycoside hydrolase family 15 protein [Deltaproteobacteria bacterium]|nr:MAG: glycoside hydrolase family 15 protein [Deltaproteobacteria bacterium]
MSYSAASVNLCLIGNCGYQALIDDRARVQWLCWPRFDSSFVFGGLLDRERGGEFSVAPRDGAFSTAQEYLPNTNVVKTYFRTASGDFEVLDFAPRFREYERFYKPTMLVRRIRRLSGRPVVRVVCRPVYDYGRVVPTPQPASNHIRYQLPDAHLRLTTNASLHFVNEGRPFVLSDDVYLVLTWGQPLEAPLTETCEVFYHRTVRYWQTWVKHGVLPDDYHAEVIRSALALKLHQFEDTGAITAATTTSLPEYPNSGRTWDYRYCWLRDACFTLGALRRLGQFEEMERFVRYLANIAEESDGALQPVYGIAGERTLDEVVLDHLAGAAGGGPVRIGNAAYAQRQHDVYGEMIAAIAPLFLDMRFRDSAGGDASALLSRLLAGIERTIDQPDVGPWEKRDRERLHTFSLLMHWTGGRAAARVAARYRDDDLLRRARRVAERAADLIDQRCWRDDRGYYADAVDSDEADASLMMMVNVGLLGRDHPHADPHVRNTAARLAARPHLLYRYRHHDGIGETHAAFTACGFWYAEALARVGRRDEARAVFEALVDHANHVGLLSEDIDPATGTQWGNFPQTYSHVGLINAAFAIAPPELALV